MMIIIPRVAIVKSSGSIKRLKVFSQILSIQYLFLHIHIIIAKLDQMYITKVFSLYSMMEILIQRIGLMITDHMILTGTMPKSPRGIISMTCRFIDSPTPLQQMLVLAQPEWELLLHMPAVREHISTDSN